MGIIHLANIGLHAIAHYEVIDVKQQIVDTNLVENLLRDTYMRSLVLHYHPCMEAVVIEYAVGSDTLVANHQPHLIGQQRSRIALVNSEEVDKMLAHPFLRCECYIAAAKHIEDFLPAHLRL